MIHTYIHTYVSTLPMSCPGSMYVRQSTGIITDDLQSVWSETLESHRPSALASRIIHRSGHLLCLHIYIHAWLSILLQLGHSSVPFSCSFLKGGIYAATCDGSIHIWVSYKYFLLAFIFMKVYSTHVCMQDTEKKKLLFGLGGAKYVFVYTQIHTYIYIHTFIKFTHARH